MTYRNQPQGLGECSFGGRWRHAFRRNFEYPWPIYERQKWRAIMRTTRNYGSRRRLIRKLRDAHDHRTAPKFERF